MKALLMAREYHDSRTKRPQTGRHCADERDDKSDGLATLSSLTFRASEAGDCMLHLPN